MIKYMGTVMSILPPRHAEIETTSKHSTACQTIFPCTLREEVLGLEARSPPLETLSKYSSLSESSFNRIACSGKTLTLLQWQADMLDCHHKASRCPASRSDDRNIPADVFPSSWESGMSLQDDHRMSAAEARIAVYDLAAVLHTHSFSAYPKRQQAVSPLKPTPRNRITISQRYQSQTIGFRNQSVRYEPMRAISS